MRANEQLESENIAWLLASTILALEWDSSTNAPCLHLATPRKRTHAGRSASHQTAITNASTLTAVYIHPKR